MGQAYSQNDRYIHISGAKMNIITADRVSAFFLKIPVIVSQCNVTLL